MYDDLGAGPVREATEHLADSTEQVLVYPVPDEVVGGEKAQLCAILYRMQRTDPGIELLRRKLSLEVIEALRRSIGEDFAVDIVERRPGDPPELVADPALASVLLGWRARRTLDQMTDSAWAGWQARQA